MANFDSGYVRPTDPEDMSRAVCFGYTLHLREQYDGEDRMLAMAPLFGLREGRFITGEASLEIKNVLAEEPVEQLTMQEVSFFDNHSKDWAFESETAQDWVTVCGLWGRKIVAGVPIGALIPRGVDGLLVAGRSISIDHDVSQSLRMQRDMQKLGEVAARAAELAVRHDCPVSTVPYDELNTMLSKSGCLPPTDERARPEPWLEDLDEIREGLASAGPGAALWSCRRRGERIIPDLRKWLAEGEGTELAAHAALALGLLRDRSAVPGLKRIIETEDRRKPEQPGGNRQEKYHAAVYLLGVLTDEGSLDLLTERYMSAESFQDVSYLAMALLRIGEAHSGLRSRIAKTLVDKVGKDDFSLRLVLQVSGAAQKNTEEDMTAYLRLLLRRELGGWDLPRGTLDVLVNEPATPRDHRLAASLG